MRNATLSLTLLLVIGLSVSTSCSNSSEDCEWLNEPCGEGATSGSATGGASGKGGATSGGSSSGGDAQGGDASGGTPAGGGAGAGGELPCDGNCTGDTPVCDQSSDTCVECLGESDCGGDTPLCDTDAKTCVECLSNDDCDSATASKCDNGVCVGCGESADCSHISEKTVCDTTADECVECTGTDYSACGEDMGTPLVCDSLNRTCTDNREHDVSACKSCVSDAHCKLGQMCILQEFNEQEVGYFCHWKKGDTANSAPASCLADGRPYVDTVEGAASVDGQVADVCALKVSTCPARNEFGIKECGTAAADDSMCQFDPPNDSKCVLADVATYRCTMTCGNDNDCPVGYSCDTGATPSVCEL